MRPKRKPPPGPAGRGHRTESDRAKNHSAANTAPGARQQSNHHIGDVSDSAGHHQTLSQSPVKTITAAADPFTPEAVFALLRDKVLKGSETLPRQNDPKIAHLAFALKIVREETQSSTEPWSEEPGRLRRIEEAIWVLTEILPGQLDYFAMAVRNLGATGAAKDRLTAFIALAAAARVARDAGLPQALNVLFKPVSPIKGWMDIAQVLHDIFHSALGDVPKAAAYRFITAVVPTITGEEPSFDAVQTAFKKKRVVKRGMRAE